MRDVFRTAVVAVCLVFAGASRADDEADRLQLAREVMVVTQAVQQVDAVLPSVMNGLKPIIARGNPKIEKDYDELMTLFYLEFEPLKAQMADDFARLGAQAYTKPELQDILAFYKSPTAVKMVKLAPSLAQAGMALGQEYGEKIGAQVSEKMKTELRKRGHNI